MKGIYHEPLSQLLLWSSDPTQPDVQKGGGRSVQVQAEQRADDVSHEGGSIRQLCL